MFHFFLSGGLNTDNRHAMYEPYTEPLDRWGGPHTKPTDKSKGHLFAIKEREGRERRPDSQGRNKRCVWTIPTEPYPEAHFAVFPEALVETPIKAACPERGVVLDPFCGTGTTLLVELGSVETTWVLKSTATI